MDTKISKSMLTAAAAVLLTAGITFAGFPGIHHSSQKHTDIDLVKITEVPGGPTLKPGTYRVTLLSNSSVPEVGFYQDGKLVGQAPVKLVDQDRKIGETQVFTNTKDDQTDQVTELDLSGWNQKILFSEAHGGDSAGK